MIFVLFCPKLLLVAERIPWAERFKFKKVTVPRGLLKLFSRSLFVQNVSRNWEVLFVKSRERESFHSNFRKTGLLFFFYTQKYILILSLDIFDLFQNWHPELGFQAFEQGFHSKCLLVSRGYWEYLEVLHYDSHSFVLVGNWLLLY